MDSDGDQIGKAVLAQLARECYLAVSHPARPHCGLGDDGQPAARVMAGPCVFGDVRRRNGGPRGLHTFQLLHHAGDGHTAGTIRVEQRVNGLKGG